MVQDGPTPMPEPVAPGRRYGRLADRLGDEDATRTAVSVLAAAFSEIKMPGVVGLRVIASALREAARSGSPDALEFASRSFDTIDPDTRRLIARRVEDYARSNAPRLASEARQTTPAPAHARQTRQARSAATGLLSAINR